MKIFVFLQKFIQLRSERRKHPKKSKPKKKHMVDTC